LSYGDFAFSTNITTKEVKPMNIPLRVKNLIARHDTSAPYRIAKELNCLIYFVSLLPTVNGFWKRLLNRWIIALNENLPEWQQTAVLCHELGHIVCHPGYAAFSMRSTSYSSTRIESEADAFSCPIVTISMSATCAASSRRVGGHKSRHRRRQTTGSNIDILPFEISVTR
jgi:hypothetical protein